MWWTIQFRIDSAFKTRHTISRNMLDMILIITCLGGTLEGSMVRVMCLADLFLCLTAVSLVHSIYTSCKSYGTS